MKTSKKEREEILSIMRTYEEYSWPGNVRKLNNTVERICLLQKRGVPGEKIVTTLQTMSFNGEPGRSKSERSATAVISPQPVKTLKAREEAQIRELLEHNGGNISRTAQEFILDNEKILL